MGLLDFVTGGKSGAATEAMRKAQEMFANVKEPTAQELTLPELQKYVQQGLLTPAQAQAVLNKQNAYDTTVVPGEGRNAQIAALNQLQDIAGAKGMDATAQAQTQQTLNALNTNMQGQRGAILDSFAQRGVPLSLASEAMQNQVLGQDAQAANANALQANADAQMRALQALQGSANVGANVQGQDWNQANTKAAAQNAINQWNSQVANVANENNAARQQQANAYNTGVKQDISNQNVGAGNYRTQYNAQIPQQQFSNTMQKAGGQANAYQGMANLSSQQGNQMMGLIGTGAGIAGSMFGGPVGGIAAKGAVNSLSGFNDPNNRNDAMAQNPYSKGGIVPGKPRVEGDSPANDTVPARLSPGELVVPRSIVKEFVGHLPKKHGAAHPDDVKSVLKALSELRDKEIESDDSAWTGGCAKGMAAGGIVQPSPFKEPGLRGDLMAGSSNQTPIDSFLDFKTPDKVTVPPLNVPSLRQPAQAQPAPREASQIAPQAAGNANPMGDYLASLRSKVNDYGPDRQKAVADYLMKQQGGFGSKLGSALSGAGDSLMMIAGKGSPGFADRYANKQQRDFENAMKSEKDYSEGKLGQLESGMKIDMMDPSSPMSKQLQSTYAPLFEKLGYKPDAILKMPASEIKSALAMAVESGGKETENMIKAFEAQANIDLRKGALEAGAAEASQKAGLEESKLKQSAASELLKRGNTKIWGVPVPFTGPSGKETEAAKNVLMENIGAGPKSATGPLGETTTKDGVLYKWSPISGKYHKAQQ